MNAGSPEWQKIRVPVRDAQGCASPKGAAPLPHHAGEKPLKHLLPSSPLINRPHGISDFLHAGYSNFDCLAGADSATRHCFRRMRQPAFFL